MFVNNRNVNIHNFSITSNFVKYKKILKYEIKGGMMKSTVRDSSEMAVTGTR